MARVSVQGSDVEGKMERNVSGEERQLSCVRGDFRLLKAKVVLASQLCKAAMSSARQRCGGKRKCYMSAEGKNGSSRAECRIISAR